MRNEERIVVVRSARRSLSLSVNGKGEVMVRAPSSLSQREIAAFVRRHTAWIERRRNAILANKPDLSDGATLCICGKTYVIAVGKRARLAGEVLYLPAQGREEALISLLRRVSRERMERLAREYALRCGFTFQTVRISSARGRWGSCSTSGTLSFSFRTAFLSDEEARYIVVHELCHTRHMDHSAAFWAEVGAILPDYRATRRRLRTYSHIMAYF